MTHVASPLGSMPRSLLRTKGRDKPQLSCNFCRKRKRLRCDRQQPCDSCLRLGQASACAFPFAQSSKLGKAPLAISAGRTDLQRRIDHLESLVRTLAPEQHGVRNAASFNSIDRTEIPSNFGHIKLKEDSASYAESEHWTAILDEINDFRSALSEHEDVETQQEQRQLPSTDLFAYPPLFLTQLDIVSALPSRPTVDSLLARYFSSADMPVSLILHREEFSNQYEHFWNDPHRAPMRWIAVLFGILFVSAYQASVVVGGMITLDEATLIEYQNIVLTSRERIIQCLRLGDYMKGGPHTVEALLFLLQLEYLQGEDKQHECWQLIGVAVRIAMKMGYHRDGSHFPHLSAYEAEMRRRIWYILIQFDIATAAQVGLPRMIRETQYDTLPPHNLLDTDFNSTTTALPSSRPESEPSLPQFLASKSKIISVYGMICDFTNSSQQHDYTEAMRLDALLNTAFSQKPMHLAPKPISRSITDGTALLVRRLYITMSFHHAQISLHRRYMLRAKSDPRYAYSHTTCMTAASAALRYQSELDEYSQPGRMLQGERYKILSLIQSEFLLATTVLCANLNHDLDHKRWETTALCKREDVEEWTRMLAESRRVWEAQREFSKEARVAVKAATIVLAKAVAMEVVEPMPSTAASTHCESNVPLTGGAGGTASELSADIVHQAGPFDYDVSLDTGFDDEMWGSILDTEQSWDAWIQR